MRNTICFFASSIIACGAPLTAGAEAPTFDAPAELLEAAVEATTTEASPEAEAEVEALVVEASAETAHDAALDAAEAPRDAGPCKDPTDACRCVAGAPRLVWNAGAAQCFDTDPTAQADVGATGPFACSFHEASGGIVRCMPAISLWNAEPYLSFGADCTKLFPLFWPHPGSNKAYMRKDLGASVTAMEMYAGDVFTADPACPSCGKCVEDHASNGKYGHALAVLDADFAVAKF